MTSDCTRTRCACQEPDVVIALARTKLHDLQPAIQTSIKQIHDAWSPPSERDTVDANPT